MDYLVRTYGATGLGVHEDTKAFQQAIDACSSAGGGRVVCEAGEYLCSTIVLKSNVELHLQSGCKIISSLNKENYENHIAILEAKDAENIAITGFGEIDGKSQRIYYDDGADPLGEAPWDYPFDVFRPRTSMFENIDNITIKDITIRNSVFWTLHFAGCRNVTVTGVKIFNDTRSNENDGIDPDCCKNVVISDCIIQAGDDPVVVKTTKDMAAKYGSAENIVVNNCVFKTKSAGLKIGTETWGDIRNINMSNCVIEECGRAVAIWARDGATIENISVSNVTARCRAYHACTDNKHKQAGYPFWWGKGEAIYMTAAYRNDEEHFPGIIRNVRFSNLNIESESSVFMSADDGVIENVHIYCSDFKLKKIGSQEPGYFDYRPSPRDIVKHSIPGIYVNKVNHCGIYHSSVTFAEECEAWLYGAELENSQNIKLVGLTLTGAKEQNRMVSQANCANTYVDLTNDK